MKFIAYCTKGLEHIVQEEIVEKIPGTKVTEVGDKRIIFESNATFDVLTSLKTVDDIGLFIRRIDNVEHFDALLKDILSIDFTELKQILQKYRKVEKNTFSLTIGSVGVKNFTAGSLKQYLGQEIPKKLSWEYTELDHTNSDIRIFIDRNTAYVSIRLTPESLYVRSYKRQAKPGSLKPTIAAAMVGFACGAWQVAHRNENHELRATSHTPRSIRNDVIKVVDNFCGSGTILGEACDFGYQVYGGDIDAESVVITRNNLENLGFTDGDQIKHLDATATNWPDHFFDYAISNLPWDKQIPVKSITHLYSGCLKEYRRIVKKDGSICLLATKPQLLIKYAKKMFQTPTITTIPISFQGQQPTIVVTRMKNNLHNLYESI